MSAAPFTDFERLCVHTITTKPWSLEQAAREYSKAGVRGITVWRDALEGMDIAQAGSMLRDHGLEIVSLCRGGFFPYSEESQKKASHEDNRLAIEQAAALGAPMVVLVCGAVPGVPLHDQRLMIRDGIEAVLPHAESHQVKLSIEPLHPMYAGDRSAVNTLKQANDLCEAIDSPYVGVCYDVYHLWWDEHLEEQTKRCGELGKLFAFHICDWKTPTTDMLLDRGLMGEGTIDIRKIRGWVEKAGFKGFNEVEIFSNRYWEGDQNEFLENIKGAYLNHS